MSQHNSLVDRQTLYGLSARVSDAHLGVQLACTKVYDMMTYNEPIPDEVYTEVGQTLATLQSAVSKLETFIFTLSEQT